MNSPGLFGINNSNRNFTEKETWGKNQFNSSFPVALCKFMKNEKVDPNYLKVKNEKICHDLIDINDLFGTKEDSPFFDFESKFYKYQKYLSKNVPGTDLVIWDQTKTKEVRALEIKLTAIPDHTTAELTEIEYGSEIVVRPDTIVYLVCSIIENCKNGSSSLKPFFENIPLEIFNDLEDLFKYYKEMIKILDHLSSNMTNEPFLLQPIWKTQGKSSKLSENCFDVFVWSSASFLKFIIDISMDIKPPKINRQNRTTIWIVKMLCDFVNNGTFNHEKICNQLLYGTRNDKAFAISGNRTNKFMRCKNLEKPRVKKSDLKKIILNGGQNYLSPERRLDAIIYNTPNLF